MSQQTINVGASPNDGTGTPLRTAFQYTNSNFSELYTALGGGSGLPGLTNQVLFNNGTSIAGDSGLQFNPTTDVLQAGLLVVPGNTQLATVGILYVGTLLNPKLKVDVAGTGVTTITEATITGDLTVDTSTLKVDSANDRVGIGTASPAAGYSLDVAGNVRANSSFQTTDGTNTGVFGTNVLASSVIGICSGTNVPLLFGTNATERMRLDTSGNLGLGVTPSAWNTVTGFQIAGGASLAGYSNTTYLSNNAYYNSGTGWTYITNAAATQYYQNSGKHIWQTASASTGAITFTQAMTLDASGNLLVGTTTAVTDHIGAFAGAIALSGTNSGTPTSYISSANACSLYYTNGGGSGYFTDFGNLIIQPRTSAGRNVVIATSSASGTPVERIVAKPNGQVRFVPLASDPSGAEAGDVYYNSTSNKLKCYNGTSWNDLF